MRQQRNWRRNMMYKVYLLPNGNTAVFANESSVPELQEPWIQLVIKDIEENGYDPEECEFTMPNGCICVPFKVKGGWNIRIK